MMYKVTLPTNAFDKDSVRCIYTVYYYEPIESLQVVEDWIHIYLPMLHFPPLLMLVTPLIEISEDV